MSIPDNEAALLVGAFNRDGTAIASLRALGIDSVRAILLNNYRLRNPGIAMMAGNLADLGQMMDSHPGFGDNVHGGL